MCRIANKCLAMFILNSSNQPFNIQSLAPIFPVEITQIFLLAPDQVTCSIQSLQCVFCNFLGNVEGAETFVGKCDWTIFQEETVSIKISLISIAHFLDMYVYNFPLYDTIKNMQAPSSLAACSIGLQSTAETINGWKMGR